MECGHFNDVGRKVIFNFFLLWLCCPKKAMGNQSIYGVNFKRIANGSHFQGDFDHCCSRKQKICENQCNLFFVVIHNILERKKVRFSALSIWPGMLRMYDLAFCTSSGPDPAISLIKKFYVHEISTLMDRRYVISVCRNFSSHRLPPPLELLIRYYGS